MRYLVSLKKIFLLLAVLPVLGSLGGCLHDDADMIAPMPEGGEGGMTLSLRVPDMASVTRAGVPENRIDELDVLVFDSNDRFVEYAPARILDNNLGSDNIIQAYFPLSAEPSDFTLMVIANFRGKVAPRVASLGTSSPGFLKSNFLSGLSMYQGEGDVIWNSGATYSDLMPMYGETEPITSLPSSDSAVGVKLLRGLARMDFVMADASSALADVTFMNFNDIAPLAPKDANQIYMGNFDHIYSQGAPFRSVKGEIYVYEQARVSESSPDDYVNSPHLLVRAQYSGSYYYYRINMVWDGSDGTTRGEYMPVMRNYRYTVTIREVLGPGYDTPAEASAARGETNNIDYGITASDETQGGNLVYDGGYMLSADKETVKLVSKGGSGFGSELTLYTDFNYISGQGGWTATANASWIKFDGGLSQITGNCGRKKTIKVYSDRDNSNGSEELTGTITVTAGRLELTVTVEQAFGTPSISVTAVPGTGNVIRWVTWNNSKILEGPEHAQIMVQSTPAEVGFTTRTRVYPAPNGEFYFSFLYNKGAGYHYYNGSQTTNSYAGDIEVLKVGPTLSGQLMGVKQWSILSFNPTGQDDVTASVELVANDLTVRMSGETASKRLVLSGNINNFLDITANTLFTLRGDAARWPAEVAVPAPYSGNPRPDQYDDKYAYRNPTGTQSRVYLGLSDYVPSAQDPDSLKLTYVLESVPYPEAEKQEELFEFWAYPLQPKANSYIVKPNTMFGAIPVSQFTGISSYPHGVPSGEGENLYLPQKARVVWSDRPGVVKEVTYQGYGPNAGLFVRTGVEGNAVVGFYHTENNVERLVWSWHIWVTADKDIIEEGIGTNNRWMDRNLGALASDPYEGGVYSADKWENVRGLAYQWGRKDPFPTKRYYYKGEGLESTVFNQDNISADITTIAASAQYPDKYSETGWLADGAASWTGAVKTVFDPCPPGWKVPKMINMPPGGNYSATDKMIDLGSHDLGTLPFAGHNNGVVFEYTLTKYHYTDALNTSDGTYTCFFVDSHYVAGDVTGNPINHMAFIRCIREPGSN